MTPAPGSIVAPLSSPARYRVHGVSADGSLKVFGPVKKMRRPGDTTESWLSGSKARWRSFRPDTVRVVEGVPQ